MDRIEFKGTKLAGLQSYLVYGTLWKFASNAGWDQDCLLRPQTLKPMQMNIPEVLRMMKRAKQTLSGRQMSSIKRTTAACLSGASWVEGGFQH